MIDHGVHVAAGHKETQAGTAIDIDGSGILPVRLGDDTHAVPVAFQNPADDGMAEGRMIYIGITDDIHKVALCPTAIQHILFAYRKKVHSLPPELILFSISLIAGKGKRKFA